MKTLASTAQGDPLFVRISNRDYEVEERWEYDARLGIGPQHSLVERRAIASFGAVWESRTRAAFAPLHGSNIWRTASALTPPSAKLVRLLNEGPLVRPIVKFFTAHHLPSLEERNEHERCTRALKRLGGEVVEVDAVVRRRVARHAHFLRQHPNSTARSQSVWLPLPSEFQPAPGAFCMAKPFLTNLVSKTIESAQDRRRRAIAKLKDPDPPTVDQDVKYLLDGLHTRNVL